MSNIASIDREAIASALLSSLGTVYDCNRVWDAWSYGTMGPDDFVPLDTQQDRIEEVVDAIIGALPSAANQPAPNWEPLFPVMLNSLDGAYWIATKSGLVMVGVYEWRQGHNPHGFKTYGGERVSADAVTHLMRYSTPLPPRPAQPD